jgi:tetratricopeptide (TPR) repeat protein
MSDPRVVEHRTAKGNVAAIIFIHGFGGDARTTWAQFPDYLMADDALNGWDVFSIGYPTTLLLPDISSLWSAEPDLHTVAQELTTRAVLPPLEGYQALAFIAHSMGGLVVQRALVDDARLAKRVTHVLLFGTPSFGLPKVERFRFWKRQTRDMSVDSDFITVVRREWTTQFGGRDHFKFLAVAGAKDEFVPRASALDGIPPQPGFPPAQQMVVPGNHLEIVKPDDPDHLSVKLAKAFFRAGVAAYDSAVGATERAAAQAMVRELRRSIGELDDRAAVNLALALESLGSADEAIEVLEKQRNRGTDATGVLAGRLKRRWMLERRSGDGDEALRLYRHAHHQARAASDEQQVSYHAINVAFLDWAYRGDRVAAQAMAQLALDACQRSPMDKWRRATEGEAAIICGDDQAAVNAYRMALELRPSSREIDSMYTQAMFELDLADNIVLAKALQTLFQAPVLGSVTGAAHG